jgi:hypothetical protein
MLAALSTAVGSTCHCLNRKAAMKPSSGTSTASPKTTIAPAESGKKPTCKPSKKPQEVSVDDWHQKAVDRLNDQTTSLPKVW